MTVPVGHLRCARQWLLVLVATIGITLVGCANPNAGSEPAPSGTSASGPFPVTVATKFGNVTLQTQPARVVALGWGDAETALALGVQPVGASDWLQFGKEGVGPWAAGLYTTPPKIIGTLEPSYEEIAALRPDLILDTKSSGDQDRHDKLSQIATTIGVAQGGDSYLTNTDQQTTMIAKALGKEAEGQTLLKRLGDAFDAAEQAHPQWKGKTVTAATKTSEGWGAYVEGSERVSFLEDLGFVQSPKIAALKPNATGFSVSISTEQLELLDADLIVAFPIFIEKSAITGDTFFQRLPAVKDGRSVIIDGDLAAAYSLGGVLSTEWAIKRIVPLIEAAEGGS
jgi:iron complex transport system substrate-binding protein